MGHWGNAQSWPAGAECKAEYPGRPKRSAGAEYVRTKESRPCLQGSREPWTVLRGSDLYFRNTSVTTENGMGDVGRGGETLRKLSQ